jgi:hypothetical protein
MNSELNTFNSYRSTNNKQRSSDHMFKTSDFQLQDDGIDPVQMRNHKSVLYPSNNLTIRALSFRNKTSTTDPITEKSLSNILSKPVPPTRTISLRKHDTNSVSLSNMRNFSYPRLNPDINNSTTCTDQEVIKVESCYKSMGTKVFASKSIAGLYSTNLKDLMDLSDWSHQCTGVPVWIFNTGVNPKRKKCLTFVLADRLTGFALRQIESVTYINDFKWSKKNLITFKIKSEFNNDYLIQSIGRPKLQHSRSSVSLKSLDKYNQQQQQQQQMDLYVLEFKNDFECSRFYDHYRSIAYDNDNKDLFDVNYKPKKNDNIIRVFCRRITKAAISGPCAFQHINSVPNLLSMLKEDINNEDNESVVSSSNTLTDDTSGPICFKADGLKENN